MLGQTQNQKLQPSAQAPSGPNDVGGRRIDSKFDLEANDFGSPEEDDNENTGLLSRMQGVANANANANVNAGGTDNINNDAAGRDDTDDLAFLT